MIHLELIWQAVAELILEQRVGLILGQEALTIALREQVRVLEVLEERVEQRVEQRVVVKEVLQVEALAEEKVVGERLEE